MKIEINNKTYNVVIIKKKNKNTYIKINENNEILVTTNYLMPKFKIKQLLIQNKDSIEKMLNKVEKRNKKNNDFYYLGKKYDIIKNEEINDIVITESKIYIKDEKQLNKWLKNSINNIFKDRLDIIYQKFNEDIPYPDLKIRSMKTRWGVCNKKGYITLNSNLIKYDIKALDYVIVHELSHYVHFNHSKDFWGVVSKYCPNYKEYRKILKE